MIGRDKCRKTISLRFISKVTVFYFLVLIICVFFKIRGKRETAKIQFLTALSGGGSIHEPREISSTLCASPPAGSPFAKYKAI